MDKIYTANCRIAFGDADFRSVCRPAALLRILQNVGETAEDLAGLGRAAVAEKYRVFWMLARVWFQLDEPIFLDEEISISTWHRAGRGVSVYRDFEICRNGKVIGRAVSAWVLAELDTHKIYRPNHVQELADDAETQRSMEKILRGISMPEGMKLLERRRVRYSDLDPNRHVNNSRYGDFICDALLPEENDRRKYPAALQINYLNETLPGEELDILGAETGDIWTLQGYGAGGAARFAAQMRLAPLKNENIG